MTESFAEYRQRLLGYLGRRDPMRVLAATPRRLVGLIEGQRRPALARRPAPGKWSTVEIVAHLADAELAFGWRISEHARVSGRLAGVVGRAPVV